MRVFFLLLPFFALQTIEGYSQNNKNKLKYLYISKEYGCWYQNMEKPNEYHIAIRDNTPDSIIVRLQEATGRNIDMEQKNYYNADLSILSYYNNIQQIDILNEYLTFYGDTIHSSKSYYPYPGYGKYKPKDQNFTVQVEALYTFTSLLIGGYICCEPVLIEKSTNSEINTDQAKMKEVYAIYQKWVDENEKTGFRNYKLPLDDTPYMWKNPTTYMKMLIGDSLFKPSKKFTESYLKIDRKERGLIPCTTFY